MSYVLRIYFLHYVIGFAAKFKWHTFNYFQIKILAYLDGCTFIQYTHSKLAVELTVAAFIQYIEPCVRMTRRRFQSLTERSLCNLEEGFQKSHCVKCTEVVDRTGI